MATDTTIHWGIEETAVDANTKITNATGKTATLNVSGDETATKVNVKAWTDEQTEANAFKREVTVSVPTVTNVVIAAKSGTNADTAAAKNGDEFTATATVVPNLLANQKVKWSVKEAAMNNLVEITPSQDTKTATVKIKDNVQTTATQKVVIQAQAVKTSDETSISAAKTAEITIAVQSSQPTAAVTGVELKGATVNVTNGTANITNANIALDTEYELNATVLPANAPQAIAWTVEGLASDMSQTINNGKLTITLNNVASQVTLPDNITLVATIANGLANNQAFVAKFSVPITKPTTATADNIVLIKDNAIVAANGTISLTMGTDTSVKAFLQPAITGKSVTLVSGDTTKFTIEETASDYTLKPVAVTTAPVTLTATVDTVTKTYNVTVAAAPAPSGQSDEPMAASLIDEQPVVQKAAPKRAAAPVTVVEPVQPAQSYVKNITLPTQRAEVGKNFDLSIANVEVVGDKQFDVEWVIDVGSADTPDSHTVRMDVPGTVTMMAIVNGGQPDGEVYTKSFDIIFVEPQPVVEPVQEPEPVQKEEPAQKEEIVREPEQELEPEEPEESEPPVEPEQPQEPEAPVVPEQPQEPEVPIVPEQPQEPEVPVEPEQPAEPEVPVEPEQPQEPEVPVEPEQPQEPEISVEPEQPQEPDETEQTDEQAPKEDKSIMIIAKGDALTNSDIVLYAVNADDKTITDENLATKSIKNAVWTIVKDDGTEATITKNVLVAKRTGTIVVKVTIGKDETRIRTQVIKIK